MKFNKYNPLPASELNTEVFVFSGSKYPPLGGGGNTGDNIRLVGEEPDASFYAHIDELVQDKISGGEYGSTVSVKQITLTARKGDVYNENWSLQIDDLLGIDYGINDGGRSRYSVSRIEHNVYRHGVIVTAVHKGKDGAI